MEKEENKEQRQANENGEKFIKVTVARELAKGLMELAERVNDGFAAGRVHRQDVASWIIARFLKTYSDSDLQQIREAHYDDSAMFDAMYRQMKETGQVPELLRDAMRKYFNSQGEGPKKCKKPLTKKYINDEHEKHEDVA